MKQYTLFLSAVITILSLIGITSCNSCNTQEEIIDCKFVEGVEISGRASIPIIRCIPAATAAQVCVGGQDIWAVGQVLCERQIQDKCREEGDCPLPQLCNAIIDRPNSSFTTVACKVITVDCPKVCPPGQVCCECKVFIKEEDSINCKCECD